MKLFIITLFFLQLNFVSYSQSIIMENYKIANVGNISIPSNMEIQSGNYKKGLELYQIEQDKKNGNEILDNRVVFQQKGLNYLEKQSFASYSRVILETYISSYGDFEKLNVQFSANASELKELNNQFRVQVQDSFAGTGLRIIRWNGVTVTTVNGKSCIKTSYVRQLENRPFVIVNVYRFQNNDRMHTLTLSYSQDDETTWKPLFSKILDSFRITNIR
jgi:hypothetical protein